MRFIIHEMAYEKPLTAGQWTYRQEDQPTGAVEKWRLSEAVDGYRFLRVDLDARAALSGRSYLYHLTLDENRRAVQLKYRFWSRDVAIAGTVLLEEDAVIMTRETGSGRQEDVLKVPASYAFWFPATAGLSLFASAATGRKISAISLDTSAADYASLMGPLSTAIDIREDPPQAAVVMGKTKTMQRRVVSWQDQQRELWLDDDGWPLIMRRQDGLKAEVTQMVVYQHIAKPGVEPATHQHDD